VPDRFQSHSQRASPGLGVAPGALFFSLVTGEEREARGARPDRRGLLSRIRRR
jgi:hypothetical protein